ncbi:glycosyltransferase family 4 protein [uncultured Ferrimonas sp.]|uniref:glycosyltransferase family 4 protein n=1 Tax=uncultured Ferrimonas sp. TaxID=432640 RepID=UPI0026100AAE|nr:glycosyltransferase family 4 protein [uncultured Ferrimonas sp.]
MTQQPPQRRCVLHIAVEYPSLNRSTNTPAVRNFIRSNPLVDYRVFALRRTANPLSCNALAGDDEGDNHVTSMKYWGLPYGILLFLSMTLVAWRIWRTVKKEQRQIAMVHAHKFSFEGIAGWWLARWLKVPLALSVRGEAEQKTLRYKPHYRRFFQRQLRDCQRLYYVSAWFKPIIQQHFKLAEPKQKLLPNFVAQREWPQQTAFESNRLISIMDLNVLDKKGLPQLLQAIAALRSTQPNLQLDIVGGGFTTANHRAQQLIQQHKLGDCVHLLGAMNNAELLHALPNYAAMVLPSRNETFGMAYVEALLSGVPVMYSRNTGIDGFLEGIEACVGAEPNSSESIATAITTLLQHQQQWRHWLAANQSLVLQRFERQHYIDEYNQSFDLLPKIGTPP